MPTVGFHPPTRDMDIEQLSELIAKTFKELEWLLSGHVDFKNIKALGITTKNLKAESIVADKIAVGAVTANKISVSELSAITANLGHITAGLIEAVSIYGSLIATANGTYPRIELSNTTNLLTAFKSLTNFLKIDADATDPGLFFDNGSVQSSIFNFTAFLNTFAVNTNGDMLLNASFGDVGAQSSSGTILDIVSEINGKANAFSGFTGSFVSGTKTVTVVNGVITSVI